MSGLGLSGWLQRTRERFDRRAFGLTALVTLGAVLAACSGSKATPSVTPNEQPSTPEQMSDDPPREGAEGETPAADSGASVGPTKGDASTPTSMTPSPAGKAAIASGDAVFFVGNSFFDSWDRKLPDWVSAIGKEQSPPFDIKTGSYIVPGNQKLSWFLQQADSQNALKSKKYKVFVIQPEEREPVDDTAKFKQAVRDWNKAIVAAGAKTMLFMTWDLSAEKGSTFFQRLAKSFDEIGTELGIPVIPVGLIYDDCNKDPFPGEKAGSYWLTGGELHQTETGSAVNAYATFGMLTGINPNGCAIKAPANTNSPEMLKYLSNKTWARVEPRLGK